MKKVTIIYRTIPQYRVEFYNQLRDSLKMKGIQLDLIYGNNGFSGRNDSVDLEWAKFLPNKSFKIGNVPFIWQPCINFIKNSDLVIVEQANMLLINYFLIVKKILFKKKFAFWGHGQNLQAPKDNLFNKFKLAYIDQSSWWFPYTDGVRKFLLNNGVSDSKITVVQNAIDTKELRKQYLSFSEDEINQLKSELSIQENDKVLIYCGALAKEKNLQFLLEVVKKIWVSGVKIKLLILGNGPERNVIEEICRDSEYLTFVGPKFGIEKAKYFRLSDLFLLPGAMGLAVLDAFAFETPIVTIQYPFHGPEIEYIKNFENGIIAEHSIEDYYEKVTLLLGNQELRDSIIINGLAEIKFLNIEEMVNNFSTGIEKCLSIS